MAGISREISALNRPERFPPLPSSLAEGATPGGARGMFPALSDWSGPASVGLFVLALLVALHAAAALVVPMTAAVILGSVLAHVGATLLPGETASSRRLIVGRSYLAAALRLLVASAAETGCELRA